MALTRRQAAMLAALAPALAACATAERARTTPAPPTDGTPDTYTEEEVVRAASAFFGIGAEAVGAAVERVFREQGQPVGYILGEEAGGAIGVGLRYGQGELRLRTGERQPIYWAGPSVGFDFGGNAARVFTLIYGLAKTEQLFQRFPGVEGSAYFIAGLGVNYQRAGDVILAPMRAGVGFRAGASVGYLSYSKSFTPVPF